MKQRFPLIELALLVLPGHGINRSTPLQKDAQALAKQTADEFTWPCTAIFGFSAGAVAGGTSSDIQNHHES